MEFDILLHEYEPFDCVLQFSRVRFDVTSEYSYNTIQFIGLEYIKDYTNVGLKPAAFKPFKNGFWAAGKLSTMFTLMIDNIYTLTLT